MGINEKLSRREVIATTGVGLVGAMSGLAGGSAQAANASDGAQNSLLPTHTEQRHYWTAEYWAHRGDIRLNMYRKRLTAPRPGMAPLPVIFFAHGSSVSARPSYDLVVPGAGEYSLMNVFAAAGFDTWTMDFEGYGRSSPAQTNSDVRAGVADLQAAMTVMERETSLQRFHFYGESSGALRAGAFAMEAPERVDHLVLTAFTYTGKGSPTLKQRAEQLEYYKTHNSRPRDLAMIRSIYTRDKPGTTDPRVADAVAKMELPFGNSVPTGTYLDMTENLPVVDPKRVLAPTLLVRGEYDGIATVPDLLDFYAALPNPNRQLAIIPGAAHSIASGYSRKLLWYVVLAYLQAPEAPHLQLG